MKAVKGLAERFFEGGILRIADGHSQPCHGLENSPMRADAEHQRDDNQPMGQFAQHEGTVEKATGKSRGLTVDLQHNLSTSVAVLT